MDALGDRMKDYERRETSATFMPLCPIYARIDGRSFSQFTKGFARPYDPVFRSLMRQTTEQLVLATGARVGYTQSDEISLAWLQDTPEQQVFFSGKKQKMVSQLAALASVHFMKALTEHADPDVRAMASKTPTFDARVFSLPNEMECVNAFVWRELDATKNALSMAARSVYSHQAMMGKNGADLHEMLYAKGINFNDYPAEFKRGVYVQRRAVERVLSEEERAKIPEHARPPEGQTVTRSVMLTLDMPPITQVTNRVDVLLRGADPATATVDSAPKRPSAPK